MGPGRHGGIGATLGAAAVAVVVAIIVIAIVSLGGGLSHPIVAQATTTAAAQTES